MNIAFFLDVNCNHGHTWVESIAKKHHVILFCTEAYANNKAQYENSNIKTYPILSNAFPLSNFIKLKRKVKEITTILVEHKIEIIHAMYAVPFAFWAYRCHYGKVVITTRGSDILLDYNKTFLDPKTPIQAISYPLLRRLLEKCFQEANAVTCTSYSQANVVSKLIKDKRKLSVVRTGVKSEDFLFVNQQTKKNKKEFVVLSPRTMRPLYNHDLIAKGFKVFTDKHPEISSRLQFIDFFSFQDYLALVKKTINDLNLNDKADMLPHQNRNELIQKYFDADVVIMLPNSDGTPVSGIETMFAKTALIIGDLEYDRDLFNENTVWRLKNKSAEEIAEKLFELYSCDKTLLNTKINSAYEAAFQNANLSSSLQKIENIYAQVMQNNYAVEFKTCKKCGATTKENPDLYLNDIGLCENCLK